MTRGWIVALFTALILLGSQVSLVSSQDCETIESEDDHVFEVLWLFRVSGTLPVAEFTQMEDLKMALERDVLLAYGSCCDDDDDEFYLLKNATVRWDLLESLSLDPIAESESNNATTATAETTEFAIPMSVFGSSNQVSEGDAVLLEEDNNEDGNDRRWVRYRGLQSSCPLPTKQDFLDNLEDRLSSDQDANIEEVFDVTQMEVVTCPAANLTNFTAGIAIDVVGNLDFVTAEGLAAYAGVVLDWWNELQLYENCDPTNPTLLSATAGIETASIALGQAVASNGTSRKLLYETIDSGASTSADASVVSTTTNLRQLEANATIPTSNSTPSAEPNTLSNETTLAPTSSLPPSSIPTLAPTARGPDLFTLLISLTGQCQGCPSEVNLFLELSTTTRQLQANWRRLGRQGPMEGEEDWKRLLSTTTSSNSSSFDPQDCFCPVDAPQAVGVSATALAEAVSANLPESVDNFVQDFVSPLEQVTVFDCQEDSFSSMAVMVFSGSVDQVNEAQVAGLFLTSYNRQAEQLCDPLVRTLSSVAAVGKGFANSDSSESPSEMPSEQPSGSPTMSPSGIRRELIRNRSSQRKLQDNYTEPSAAPMMLTPNNVTNTTLLRNNVTNITNSTKPTQQPTTAPTSSGPDLFYLIFQITGTCNGCAFEANLFDELNTGRRGLKTERSKRSQQRRRGSQADESTGGLCACDEPDADFSGPSLGDLVDDMTETINSGNISGIDQIEELTELEQSSAPSMNPTTQLSESPSSAPTVYPSEKPSSSPSWRPSGSPSTVPSELPSTSPSREPSASPSTLPSALPSLLPSSLPSVLPSEAPSRDPSAHPSQFPSEYPSEFPSEYPSQFPSQFPSGTPSQTPSEVPSSSPSIEPSSAPSEMPSSLPSSQPSSTPSETPSGTPSSLPSSKPSSTPSETPSGTPSSLPSSKPSSTPSAMPSGTPSLLPSSQPSSSPTLKPSATPSSPPSNEPTAAPSLEPSMVPSFSPSLCAPNNMWERYDSNTMAGFGIVHEVTGARISTPSTGTGDGTFRVQFDVPGNIDITVLCCSTGSIRVSRGCPGEDTLRRSLVQLPLLQTAASFVSVEQAGGGQTPGLRSQGALVTTSDGCTSGDNVVVATFSDVEADEPIFITITSAISTPQFCNEPSSSPSKAPTAAPTISPSSSPSCSCNLDPNCQDPCIDCFCDPDEGCLQTAACPRDCDAVLGCVDCLEDTACRAVDSSLPFCDTNKCVECSAAADCTRAEPFCENNECVECTANSQCNSGLCVENACAECSVPAACPSAEPFCENNECVQCTEQAHCTGATSRVCANNKCVECVDTSDCPASEPVCVNNNCLECQADSDCPNTGDPYCSYSCLPDEGICQQACS